MQHEHADGHTAHGTVKQYVFGFLLSIVFTVIPLVLVVYGLLPKRTLIVSIVLMAILQFVIQLFFFMHIREGEKPRYNVMALILGVVIVFTIVAGSMWIMSFNSIVQ